MSARTSEPAPRPAARDPSAQELPRFVSVSTVAAQLSVSDDLVRDLIERGEPEKRKRPGVLPGLLWSHPSGLNRRPAVYETAGALRIVL